MRHPSFAPAVYRKTARSSVSTKVLQRGAATSLLVRLAIMATSFGVQVVLARALGAKGYGEYMFAFAWMQTLATFARFGLDKVVLRYASVYRAHQHGGKLAGLLRWVRSVGWMASISMTIVFAAAAYLLRFWMNDTTLVCLLIGTAILPFYSRLEVCNSTIRAFDHVNVSLLSNLAIPLCIILATLFFTELLHADFTSPRALTQHLVVAAVTLIAVATFQKVITSESCNVAVPQLDNRAWMGAALPLAVVALFIYLQGRTGTIITGIFCGAEEAGAYAAMQRIADVVRMGVQTANMVAASHFAVLYSQNRWKELQRCARWSANTATIFALVSSGLIILSAPWLIGLFGDKFAIGYPVLNILLGGALIGSICASAGNIISMSGHYRQLLWTLVIGLVTNLSLCVLLIPLWGIAGAALANSAAIAVWKISMVCVVKYRIGIWTNAGRPNSEQFI